MTRKTGTNKMSDEQRLNQVESDVNELRNAMTTLTNNVDKGFSEIHSRIDDSNDHFSVLNTKIDAGNEATLEKIGSVYGTINTHALENVKSRTVSWPLVVSIIAVIFVASSFFYTTINDRFDRTIQYEKELRHSENQKILLQSELDFTKKLLEGKPSH